MGAQPESRETEDYQKLLYTIDKLKLAYRRLLHAPDALMVYHKVPPYTDRPSHPRLDLRVSKRGRDKSTYFSRPLVRLYSE